MLATILIYLLIAVAGLVLLGILLSPLALLTGLWASVSAKADADALADIERN